MTTWIVEIITCVANGESRSRNRSTPSVRLSVRPSETLRGWLVCVICVTPTVFILHCSNFAHRMAHMLKMCTSYFKQIWKLPASPMAKGRSKNRSTPSVRPQQLGVPSLCNLELRQFLFLTIQTLHTDYTYIEKVHVLFWEDFSQYVSDAGPDPTLV